MINKPNKIIIHCSDSPQNRGDDASTIHKWHLERGWDGIGYHYVILENGIVQNGRPDYWVGSHCRGENSNSIGICLIGIDTFTDEQFEALTIVIRELVRKHNISKKNIYGHYQFSSKTCPNFNVTEFVYTRLDDL